MCVIGILHSGEFQTFTILHNVVMTVCNIYMALYIYVAASEHHLLWGKLVSLLHKIRDSGKGGGKFSKLSNRVKELEESMEELGECKEGKI